MFDSVSYDCAADSWALGCVIYEMFALKQLFRGESTAETSFQIFGFLGPPTMEDVLAMNPKHKALKIPELNKAVGQMAKVLPQKMPATACILVSSLLRYAPNKRMKPAQ